MRYSLIFILFLILTSCRPLALSFASPEGPPEFKLGWEDGCDSGLSAEDSGTIYRLAYGFKKRPEMIDNEQYRHGWTDGFQYCRFSAAALED